MRRWSSYAVSSANRANQVSTTSSRSGNAGKLFSATKLEDRDRRGTGRGEHGHNLIGEELDEPVVLGRAMVDRAADHRTRSVARPRRVERRVAGPEPHGLQQQGVVRVDHRRVRRRGVRAPDRPVVERVQRVRPRGQVAEPADPDEPIRIVQIAELTDDVHTGLFLPLHQLCVEKIDQGVPLPGVQRVLAQVDDGATLVHECEQTTET